MRYALCLLTLLAVMSLLACGRATPEPPRSRPFNVQPAPSASPPPSKDGTYNGRGTVTKLNHEAGSVEMDHEEIEGLMPAMRMEFYVTNKASLRGLKIGDNVTFSLLYDKGTEKITSIKKEK